MGADTLARRSKMSCWPIKQWREAKKVSLQQSHALFFWPRTCALAPGNQGHWCGRLRGSAARRAQRKRRGDGVDRNVSMPARRHADTGAIVRFTRPNARLMAGAIQPSRVTEQPMNWRAYSFPPGYPISQSRSARSVSKVAPRTARCRTWLAGPTRKVPRCRCGGCAGNRGPISPSIFGDVMPKTGVKRLGR
jgi:hypothetical protein